MEALNRKVELTTLSWSQPKSDFISRINEGLQQDPLVKYMLGKVLEGKIKWFWQDEGILLSKGDRLFMYRWGNLQKEVIKEWHYSKWANHHGVKRVTALVQVSFFWPHIWVDIEANLQTYLGCQQDKINH